MRRFIYHVLSDGEMHDGKIKASSYENAVAQVKYKFHGKEIDSIRVFRTDNHLKKTINFFVGNFSTLIFKIVPIAFGVLLVYIMLTKCSF